MTKTLGPSPTLGFWNKHLLSMDEMYAYYPFEPGVRPDEDLPIELLAIWDGPERDQISKVFDHAEVDGQKLVRACVEDAVAWFSQPKSPFRAEISRTKDSLKARAKIRPARGDYGNGDEIWLTVSLDNSSDGKTMPCSDSSTPHEGAREPERLWPKY